MVFLNNYSKRLLTHSSVATRCENTNDRSIVHMVISDCALPLKFLPLIVEITISNCTTMHSPQIILNRCYRICWFVRYSYYWHPKGTDPNNHTLGYPAFCEESA